MKYIKTVIETPAGELASITIDYTGNVFTNFSAEVGNSSYDKFLVDAKLTDKQVKALKPDVWYDFPEGDK
jgi:hypothetical protein